MESKRGSTRLHSVENSLSKRLWTCLKTDYGMNELQVVSNGTVITTAHIVSFSQDLGIFSTSACRDEMYQKT